MSPPIAQTVSAFLASLRAKVPRTRTTYATGVRRFTGWVTSTHGTAEVGVRELDDRVLEAFYLALVDEFGRESQATLATYLASARAFLRFAVREGEISGATLERAVERLRAVRAKPHYRTPRVDNALALIVDYVKNSVPALIHDAMPSDQRLRLLRDRALLMVLFCTGMRRAEAARLDRRDVDDGASKQALITGKGERERVVFFDDDTRAAVAAYVQQRTDAAAPLFVRHHGKARDAGRGGERLRLSPQSVWKIVRRYAVLVGVPASPHDFRHLKATALLNRGANLSEVQDILGHASPDTTKRIYARYEVRTLRAAFDRYSVGVEELAASVRRHRLGA